MTIKEWMMRDFWLGQNIHLWNETINIEVNDHIYRIKLVEDMHGTKCIVVPSLLKKVDNSEDSFLKEKDEEVSAWSEDESKERDEVYKNSLKDFSMSIQSKVEGTGGIEA